MGERPEERVHRCPTCGADVHVVSSGEGTSHYEPADRRELERLRAGLQHAGFQMATGGSREAEALRRYCRSILLDDPAVARMDRGSHGREGR